MASGAWSLSWTLIAALSANAEEARPSSVAGSDEISLVWIDVLGVVPSAFAAATEEVSRVLEKADLEARFRRADASSVSAPDEIRVILLPRSGRPPAPGRLVMGAARACPTPAEGRTVWVYVEPVVNAVGLRSAAENPPQVARALGRVIAHEVIHLLAPRLGHSGRGLMAGVLTLKELAGPGVDLAPDFRLALRSSPEAGADVVAAGVRAGRRAAGASR